jgi:hypothetical protein
MHCILSD